MLALLTTLTALTVGQVVAQQQYPIAAAGGSAGTSLAAQINPAYLFNPAQNIHPGWTVGPRGGTLPAGGDGGNEALLLFLAQQAQHKPCATCANGGAGLATLPQQYPAPPPNYGGGGLFGGGSDFLQQYLLFQLLSQNQSFGFGGGGPRGYLPPIEPRPLIPPQAYCPPVPTPQPIIITSPAVKRRGLFR